MSATRLTVVKPSPSSARAKAGLSKRDVARISGLSLPTIRRIELKGDEPYCINEQSAELYAHAVGLSIDEIDWSRSLTIQGCPPLIRRRLDRKNEPAQPVICQVCNEEKSLSGECMICV